MDLHEKEAWGDDIKPYVVWIEKFGTVFIWNGKYDSPVGMLVDYTDTYLDPEVDEDLPDNASPFVENDYFYVKDIVPEAEERVAALWCDSFPDRAAKEKWFIAVCQYNFVTAVEV